MNQIEIEPIPCLKDNYAYLISRPDSADAYVVDPSEAEPIVTALQRRSLTLRGILATHHHADHVGGIADLVARAGAGTLFVAGHALDRERIPAQTEFVDVGTDGFVPTRLTLFGRPLLAMHIPGHTRAAIAWGIPDGGGDVPADVFTGDTLFGAGCGRLFEGTPAQMYASLKAITAIPADRAALVRPRVHREQPALRRDRRARQPSDRRAAGPPDPADDTDDGGAGASDESIREIGVGRGAGGEESGEG